MTTIKTEQRSRTAFEQVWASYRHLLKDDLSRMAHRRMKMISEMKLFSTTQNYIDRHLEDAFEELAKEILDELAEQKPRKKLA